MGSFAWLDVPWQAILNRIWLAPMLLGPDMLPDLGRVERGARASTRSIRQLKAAMKDGRALGMMPLDGFLMVGLLGILLLIPFLDGDLGLLWIDLDHRLGIGFLGFDFGLACFL